MKLSKIWLASAALAALALAHPTAAQPYPSKPVKVVTPFPSGSGPDAVLRLVGEKLSRAWGRQVMVENRPGANGAIAIGAVKSAAPDGYTLVQMDDTHLAAQPHLYQKLPYDPVGDFDPVATLFKTYFFVVVPANSSWKSMDDLVASARAKTGALTYGSWFIGSPGHLGAALLEAATGTQMTHVPFREMTQLYGAVGNNDVDWAFGSAASAGAMYRAKKVKFLAVAAPKRIQAFSDVPTVAEAGGPPNLEVKAWVALLAPRGTPKDIIARINEGVGKALAEPDVRERLAAFAFEPYAATPDEIARQVAADSRTYGEVIKRAKISLD